MKTLMIGLIIVLIFVYHLVIVGVIKKSGYESNFNINPITNRIVIKLSESESYNLKYKVNGYGFWIVIPRAESFFNDKSKKYFDIYSMIFSYSVEFKTYWQYY